MRLLLVAVRKNWFERSSFFVIGAEDIEMPLYKLVLADPKHSDFVDVVIRWNFKAGCEALVVVARKGQVHCKDGMWVENGHGMWVWMVVDGYHLVNMVN